jgi:hypothetical protein
MGLIIAAGNTKPAFPYDYYYGVKVSLSVSDPAVERVGRTELHQSLPVQSKMRRCLLKDDGTVNYYLHPTDSTKRDSGSAADLTGAAGQVMVELPEHYRKFEFDGLAFWALLSEYALPGFHKVRKCYRSAYEASVDRTVSATPKLASVVNTTTAFRGGNNTSGWDDTYRSLLGRPATNISLTNFRAYARNRGTAGLNGAGWNCDLYEAQRTTYWFFVVEYATRNCQAAFNAEKDANGYRQGGLGDGVTTMSSGNWSTFNSYNPFVPCGITNSLGNATGVVSYTIDNESGISYTFNVPSYRGIENPFGHVWSWTDGCLCVIQSADGGGRSIFFICDDPALFSSTSVAAYTERGDLPRGEGYVKTLMLGEYGENMPTAVGGGSSTYYCDYFYTNIQSSGEAIRGVVFGGRAYYGTTAGLAYANTSNAPTHANTSVGSRLCFIPEAA